MLALALAAWIHLAAGSVGGRSGPWLWLLAGAAVLMVLGRRLCAPHPSAIQRAVAIGILGAVIVTFPGVLEAGGAPLGYANANSALASLGALSAFGVAATVRDRTQRHAWVAVAGASALAVLVTGSVAGIACLALAGALLTLSTVLRRPAVAILGGAILVALVLGVTLAIARGADPIGLRAIEAERAGLWAAAADLAAEHPLRGIGPGRFAEVNPVSSDADLRWVHHDYLQVAAETGLVGLGLVLALVAWAYVRLGLTAISDPGRASVGAALVTVVALHSTVDHVSHSAAVPLTLALLLGSATARPRHPPNPGGRGSHRRRP